MDNYKHINRDASLNKPAFMQGLCVAMVLLILIMLPLHSVAAKYEAGDFTFSHLGLADGLDCRRIYSFKQTDDGEVWFTTKSCVGRYNGVGIENFYLFHIVELPLRSAELAAKAVEVVNDAVDAGPCRCR